MSRTGNRRLAAVLVAAFVFGCQAAAQVHTSPMAGKWFPAERAELRDALETAFQVAEKRAAGIPVRKQIRALVAPHAGLPYSGVVAASAFRLLSTPKNVILLGFSHTKKVNGVAAPDLDAYTTPLGEIAVNRELLGELDFPLTGESELCDHSLENLLPFLQYAAPEAAVAPLYVGDLAGKALAAAARKLAARVEKGDVLIASSDFTHYGQVYGYVPYPDDDELPKRLFSQATAAIGSIDVRQFDRHLAATGDTICGRQPIRLLMKTLSLLKDDTYLQLMDYMTSADITGDHSASVGYGALAFYPSSAFRVDATDRRKLLRSARSTLEAYLAGSVKVGEPVPSEERSPDLQQRTCVFVTVRKKGELRGCMGTFAARKPLWDAVADRTLAATSADPRFPPLTAKDRPVTLEISVITPTRRIGDWRRYRPGYGAVLLLDSHSSTLLPQVAEEMGWNTRQLLENLSRKAGLKPGAYRNPKARLYVFDAQVFSEVSEGTPIVDRRQQ